MVFVADATADPEVKHGGAVYAWRYNDKTFNKVYEWDSLDIPIEWNSGLPVAV
jgi:hypothetical protein